MFHTINIDLIVGRHATDEDFDISYYLSAELLTTDTTTVLSYNVASNAAFLSNQSTGTTAGGTQFYLRKTVTDVDIVAGAHIGLGFLFANLATATLRVFGVRISW